MKKYLFLQLKRAAAIFPYVLAVTLVLLLGVSVALSAMLGGEQNKSENTRVKIGVSGDMESSFLRLGLGAFQAFDDTKYSIELIEYKEAEAAKALKSGEISAYIVMPEDFVDKAFRGEIDPVRFVTTANASDIITMFKNEILSVITDMVVASQQGTYGLGDALRGEGCTEQIFDVQSDVSMDYFELILSRSNYIEIEELGVGSKLTTENYYLCSLLIFFIMLMGLPYAVLYCRRDNSLTALLSSRGVSCFKILLSEYISHLASLACLLAVIFGAVAVADGLLGLEFFKNTEGCPFLYVMPAVIMLSAFNLMIFELSSGVISGVLTHFFLSLSLCYVSGCFYPIHSFPAAVQKLSALLPTGLAREQLAGFFTGESGIVPTLLVLLYAAAFFAVTLLAKRIRLMSRTGGVA